MQGVQIIRPLVTSDDLGFSLQALYVVLNEVACLVRTSKIDQVVEARISDRGMGTVHISVDALNAAVATAAAAAAKPAGPEQPEEQVAATEAATTAKAVKAKGGTCKHAGKDWPAAALYELHLSLDGKVSLG